MKQRDREQITAKVKKEALDALIEINAQLRILTGKKREVSPGKILETLLLWDNARDYVLKELG